MWKCENFLSLLAPLARIGIDFEFEFWVYLLITTTQENWIYNGNLTLHYDIYININT